MTLHKLNLGGVEKLQRDLALPKCHLIYNSNFICVNRSLSSVVNSKLKDLYVNNENTLLIMNVTALDSLQSGEDIIINILMGKE